jgi:hypothetical protein
MLRRMALVRTDVSEELSTSIISVTRIGELGTALAVTSNRRTLRRNSSQETPFFLATAMETSYVTMKLLFPAGTVRMQSAHRKHGFVEEEEDIAFNIDVSK